MLNEKKIRLMAKAAAYEKGAGKKALEIHKYFPTDFVGIELLKSWAAYTAVYLLCFGMWAFYHLDTLMDEINHMDYVAFGKKALMIYGIFLVMYLGITYGVSRYKYHKAQKSVKMYDKLLKQLLSMYRTDSKGQVDMEVQKGERVDDDFTRD